MTKRREFEGAEPLRTEIQSILKQLADRADLAREQARSVFTQIMTGQLATPDITRLLQALRDKGECVEEVVGAAEAMRINMRRVRCERDCIDTCGTGGDGASTFNVSTTAAIIAAAAGAVVAKHGNRSTTRRSGSTEVLIELGIDVDADQAIVERCLNEIGIAYLNARRCHPAMKHAAASRQAIDGRTIFNLLGPLTNPAGAKRQIVGVPEPELMDLVGQAVQQLGAEHVWVVHGSGLCDLTITGLSEVLEVTPTSMKRFAVSPEQVGLELAPQTALTVSSPRESARVVHSVLNGDHGGPRDHALMNAAGALVVAGIASSLANGIERAAAAIDKGAARSKLQQWQSMAGKM